ncbi:MAG: electron transport complex subunit RsxB [Polaromonas sp.]|nr:electron transport complex subunit RsxB [Polaromonas sp.]
MTEAQRASKTLAQSALAARIHSALPQTQCTRCGYPDCAAYAQAIATGQAAINQCPPGGAEGVQRLAAITGLSAAPLNPANGTEGPRSVAIIDEKWCIGCTLCLPVCPTDAILGSNKMMHTVIEAHCTGCELCIPVCPVDCISLESVTGELTGWRAWSIKQADEARNRYEFHSYLRPSNMGRGHESSKKPALQPIMEVSAAPNEPALDAAPAAERKRAMIDAALARARAKAKTPP